VSRPAEILRRRLAAAVLSAGRSVGVDMTRRSVRRNPDLRRQRLLADAGITVVLDVGANCGQYATGLRRHGYSGRIISFEPLGEPFAELSASASRDPLWRCERVALGADAGTATLHVAANGGASSSFLPMTPLLAEVAPYTEYVGDETVEVVRLDDLRADLVRPDDRAFLKIDVQGFEHEVLQGGAHALASMRGVELELSLAALYAGQPLMHDLLGTLCGAGFTPFSFEPAFMDVRTGRVLQVDAVLVRDD
jgi:FkbM family methyltransferase